LGIIKYLLVGMVQISRKFVMMDVVIVYVPPTYGMLLSRHWETSFFGRPTECMENPTGPELIPATSVFLLKLPYDHNKGGV